MNVEIAGITKIYKRNRALSEVRLEIPPGRVVAVVGLNGAGKSTLLHALAGLLSLDGGDIYFDEEPFTRDRVDLRRRFAFLPDFPLFYGGMTVLEHIAMVLRLYEKESSCTVQRVMDLLGAFSVTKLGNSFVDELSRGEAYKVALVALMAVEPELWLLDEPMASGMDALGLREFQQRARAAANQGATVIYTTQILAVAEKFSDEVVVLDQGRVHARGPVASLESAGNLEELFAAMRETA